MRRRCVTMLERACRGLYVLAELLCVVGLLVLCVLKVQHFLSQPVSTTVSFQPSRAPAITVCHQLVNDEILSQLSGEAWDNYNDLWYYNQKTLQLLQDVRQLIDGNPLFLRNETESEETDTDSSLHDGLQNITVAILTDKLNKTEEIYQLQIMSDRVYDYAAMNDTQAQLEDTLRKSAISIRQAISAVQLYDLQALNATIGILDSLTNVTEEIDARLDASEFEWRDTSPIRQLVEGTRPVDLFVISCRRANVSCMPGEGGVWQVRHVLETKETCYTLAAWEAESSGRDSIVVLELRGSEWRDDLHYQTSPPDTDSSVWGDEEGNTTTTTWSTTTELVTELATGTTAEAVSSAPTEAAAEVANESTTNDNTRTNTTQDPTFNITTDYDYYTYSQPVNSTDDGPILPTLSLNQTPNFSPGFAPPSFVTSLNTFEGSPDAIQYITYKFLLHAAPVPLLNSPGGFGERSFEIFHNQDWVEVDVRMEELRSLNRKSRPCEEDPAYSRGSCLSNCQAAAHARAAGCQLEAVWPATAQGLPQCRSAAQLERLRAKLETPAACDCPRPCHQGRVSAVVQASSRTISDREVTVTMRLDGDMQVIDESVAYTAGSLLTDFGGNLGLTMGFSLLTIVELFKKITLGFLERGGTDQTRPAKNAERWAESMA